jgi:DNA polymerase III delta subunit
MIYIVHGEDTSKSRSLILNHQKKLGVPEKVLLDVKSASPNELYERSISTSLFGEAPLIILDVTDAGRSNMEGFIETMKKIPEATTLIVFSTKQLSKTNAFISNAAQLKAKVLENTVFADANIFKFTEVLYSKNRPGTYRELNKLLSEDYDPFYIFSMVLYGIRNLAKVLWSAPSTHKMKPFQLDKNRATLEHFSEDKVKQLFADLYDIEKKAKTGQVPIDMMLTLGIEKVLNS